MAFHVGGIGVIMAIILPGTFFIGLRLWDPETARTMTFPGFVLQEYLRLLAIRVQEGMPPLTNGWLWVAVGLSLLLQVVIVYIPIGSGAFGTVRPGLGAVGCAHRRACGGIRSSHRRRESGR